MTLVDYGARQGDDILSFALTIVEKPHGLRKERLEPQPVIVGEPRAQDLRRPALGERRGAHVV